MIWWLVLCVFHMFVGEIAGSLANFRNHPTLSPRLLLLAHPWQSIGGLRPLVTSVDLTTVMGMFDRDTNGFYTRGRCMYIQDIDRYI